MTIYDCQRWLIDIEWRGFGEPKALLHQEIPGFMVTARRVTFASFRQVTVIWLHDFYNIGEDTTPRIASDFLWSVVPYGLPPSGSVFTLVQPTTKV